MRTTFWDAIFTDFAVAWVSKIFILDNKDYEDQFYR